MLISEARGRVRSLCDELLAAIRRFEADTGLLVERVDLIHDARISGEFETIAARADVRVLPARGS